VVERQGVLELLHSERFVDKAPEVIVPMLLDQQRWLCSARTMYRLLAAEGELRERRRQRRHPEYKRPHPRGAIRGVPRRRPGGGRRADVPRH
jgi:putative transposase